MTLKGVTNQLQISIMHVASVLEFIFLFYVKYFFVIGSEPDHAGLCQNSTPGSDCPIMACCDHIKPQPLQLIRPFCHLGSSHFYCIFLPVFLFPKLILLCKYTGTQIYTPQVSQKHNLSLAISAVLIRGQRSIRSML